MGGGSNAQKKASKKATITTTSPVVNTTSNNNTIKNSNITSNNTTKNSNIISNNTGNGSTYVTGNSGSGTGWKETVYDNTTTYDNKDAMISAWNNAVIDKMIGNGYTQDSDGNWTTANGNQVFTFTDDLGGYHFTTKEANQQDQMDYYNGSNASYNINGVNYDYKEPETNTGSSYDFGTTLGSVYDSALAAQQQMASNVEKVNSYIDDYLDSIIKTGTEQAEQSYNSNADAAYQTWRSSINDALQNYNNNITSKQNSLQTLRGNYESAMSDANTDYFNAIQEARENAAARGLTNSGLMAALENQIVNQLNSQTAAIEQEYNNNVLQLNNEISTLVQNYGLSKSEADEIYNNTIQTLTANKNSQLEEVKANAWQTVLDYQKEIDIYNASAYNDMQQNWMNNVNDIYNNYANNLTSYTIAQLQADTDMSIAQLQDETDRWVAQLDSDTKKWIQKFDRKTQTIIANLNNESAERIAQIDANASVSAASVAANIEYKLSTEINSINKEEALKESQATAYYKYKDGSMSKDDYNYLADIYGFSKIE